jgi:hypothetical protein
VRRGNMDDDDVFGSESLVFKEKDLKGTTKKPEMGARKATIGANKK